MNWLDTFAQRIVMPDLVTTIVATGIIAAVSFVAARVLGRVQVKRIRSSTDPDFEAFYALSRINIPPDELEPKAEMARYLDEGEDDRHRSPSTIRFEDYFAVAKRQGAVVGFINATIYPGSRLGFINYLGTATDEIGVPRIGSSSLLKALGRRTRKLGCAAIIYEIDALSADLTREENGKRHAKARLFVQIARNVGYLTFQMPVDYLQPQLSILEGQAYEEVPLILMYVSLQGTSEIGRDLEMTKARIIEILDAVLLEWYLDIYDRQGDLRDRYRRQLLDLRNRLTESLPETVTLRPIEAHWCPPLRAGVSAPSLPVGLSPARRRRREAKARASSGIVAG